MKKFRKNLEKDFFIDRIILFGSRATGEAGRDSDVDLIIISKDFEGKDHFERSAKMYDYWDSELPVDFLCYTPEEFKKLDKQVSIVSKARKSGKPR